MSDQNTDTTKHRTTKDDSHNDVKDKHLPNSHNIHIGKVLQDPLLIQSCGLNTDIYALTWTALRIDVWEKVEEFRGNKISMLSQNFRELKINFFVFVGLVLSTLLTLFWEVFNNDLYTDVTWTLFILRMTLIGWCQKHLSPEFNQAIVLLRYTVKHSNDLTHPYFAFFIGLCQLILANLTLISVILFICMADSALELLMNFSGLLVTSELDDWIGGNIILDNPHGGNEKYPDDDFDLNGLNEKMSLRDKLAMIPSFLKVVDDQNYEFSESMFIKMMSWLIYEIPWILLPLIAFPINSILLKIRPHRAFPIPDE